MTIAELKTIPIETVIPYDPAFSKKQYELWYNSPLHEESTPSFKVDTNKNLWYDHAQGKGGTVIDIVMILHNLDFVGACKKLGDGDIEFFSFSPPKPLAAGTEKEDGFTIVSVRDLKNPALLDYITKERKIGEEIAKKFVREIYFKKENSDKNLFAIAFANDEGGYETRNALYKGNIDGKTITTIKGTGNGKVAVFEGFMDFLSVLSKYKTDEITDDVIVLNSLSMIGGVKEILQGYKEVKYFLDNDKAGREATADLLATVGGKDYSRLYANYKDANDWLLQGVKK